MLFGRGTTAPTGGGCDEDDAVILAGRCERLAGPPFRVPFGLARAEAGRSEARSALTVDEAEECGPGRLFGIWPRAGVDRLVDILMINLP